MHPVTHRAALYVNPVYTTRFEGWTPAESQALLAHLHRHSINENFTCRLRWSPHTLAIWDNRCTMHNALNDYSGVRREMYRTSVIGAAPNYDVDYPAQIKRVFELARRFDVDIDMHIDSGHDPASLDTHHRRRWV